MNQQPPTMGAQQPKVRPWLLIVFIVVVLGAGGYFAWYFLMGPGKKVETSTTTTTSEPESTATGTSESTSTTSSTTPAMTPEKVAENFYNYYLNLVNPNGQANSQAKFQSTTQPYKLKSSFSAYLTDTLIANLETLYNNASTNSDPILCAQDTPSTITYDVAKITNNTATSVVNMQFTPVNKVTLGYEKDGNIWKINTITCP